MADHPVCEMLGPHDPGQCVACMIFEKECIFETPEQDMPQWYPPRRPRPRFGARDNKGLTRMGMAEYRLGSIWWERWT